MSNPNQLILIVEDDPNDVIFLQKAFRNAGAQIPMQNVENGEAAVNYLAGNAPFGNREKYPLPSIIILDLKLPLKSGLEVLEWIRQRPGLKRMIVLILTSSKETSDITRAYDLGVNSYLVKPASFLELVEVAKAVKTYWLTFNERPKVVET